MTGMEQPTFLPTVSAVLTVADLDCTKGDEPLIRDLRLAEGLEMANRHAIRRIIKKHEEALESFGILISHRDAKLGAGRPSSSYYLNKRQALYTIAKSDTPVAAAITVQMVEVFDAYKSGELAPRRPSLVRQRERRTSTKLPHAIKLQTNIDRLEALVTGLDHSTLPGTADSCPLAAMAREARDAILTHQAADEEHMTANCGLADLVWRASLEKLAALEAMTGFYTATSAEGALFQVCALKVALGNLHETESRQQRDLIEEHAVRIAAQLAIFLEQAAGIRREDLQLDYYLDRRLMNRMILRQANHQNLLVPVT